MSSALESLASAWYTIGANPFDWYVRHLLEQQAMWIKLTEDPTNNDFMVDQSGRRFFRSIRSGIPECEASCQPVKSAANEMHYPGFKVRHEGIEAEGFTLSSALDNLRIKLAARPPVVDKITCSIKFSNGRTTDLEGHSIARIIEVLKSAYPDVK